MTPQSVFIWLAVLLTCGAGFAFLKWMHRYWRNWRLPPTGWLIWVACLVTGLALIPIVNPMPRGPLRNVLGYGSVFLFGGALGFMGLYMGWLMSLLGVRAREWLIEKFKL